MKRRSVEFFEDGNKLDELKFDKLRKEIKTLEKRLKKLEKVTSLILTRILSNIGRVVFLPAK